MEDPASAKLIWLTAVVRLLALAARTVRLSQGRGETIIEVYRGYGTSDEIERLATAVGAAGSSLVLAADSAATAEHAVGLGLIAPEGRAAVSAERETGGVAEAVAGTHRVGGSTAADTARKIADGELRSLLEPRPDRPPNVVVEPADRNGISTPPDPS